MYTLYWSPDSGSLAPEIMLEEVGAPYRREATPVREGANRKPAYLELNPAGQVPTLILPDGSLMTESAAMVMHLTEAFPRTELTEWWSDRSLHPQFYRWLVFLSAHVYQSSHRGFRPERFTSDRDGLEPVREAARKMLDAYWDIVESQLRAGPHFLGAHPSGVDVYAMMLADWHPETERLFAGHPRLAALYERVRSRPKVEEVRERNR